MNELSKEIYLSTKLYFPFRIWAFFILLVSFNKARLTKCKQIHKFLSNKNTAEMCVFKNTDNFMEFILIMSNIKEKLAEAPSFLVLVATL